MTHPPITATQAGAFSANQIDGLVKRNQVTRMLETVREDLLKVDGVGGVIAPFVGIKLIDLAVAGLGLA